MQLVPAVLMASFLIKGHSICTLQFGAGDGATPIVCDLLARMGQPQPTPPPETPPQRAHPHGQGTATPSQGFDIVLALSAARECSHETAVSVPTFHVLRVADDGVQGLLFLALCCLRAVCPASRNAGGRNAVSEAPTMEDFPWEACWASC